MCRTVSPVTSCKNAEDLSLSIDSMDKEMLPPPSQQPRNVFTVTKATATKARHSYRKDLDMKRQLHTILRHRKKVSESANMLEWQATFASKSDHVFFILQLLSEAERYRGDCNSLLFDTLKAEHLERMTNADSDIYCSILDSISGLRLFHQGLRFGN